MTRRKQMTVKIGTTSYQVKRVKDLHDIKDGSVKRGLLGCVDYTKREIEIDAALSPPAAIDTVWHEVVHAILYHAGHTEQNENQVLALGYGIIDFLRNNPAVVKATIEGASSCAQADRIKELEDIVHRLRYPTPESVTLTAKEEVERMTKDL